MAGELDCACPQVFLRVYALERVEVIKETEAMYGKSYKTITVETTVASAIEDAFSEISELATELRDWEESMSDNFSGTEKYQLVSEAADALEEHQELGVDLPDAISSTSIKVTQGVKKYKSDGALSRAARLGNAVLAMRGAQEHVTSLDDADNFQELADRLDELADAWDSIDIPTMYR